MHRVQGGAAVDPRVQVARARAQDEVEVDETAGGDVELGHAARRHAAVEDDRRVRPTLVGREEVDDLVAAGLLLGVAAHAHVDGKLSRGGELGSRLDQHVELALVVGDAAAEEPAVALLERERVRLPELERVGRLDVDVAVDHDRRPSAVRGGQVADDQRLRLGRDDLGGAAGSADELGEPLGRAPDVVRAAPGSALTLGMRDQLRQLVEPGLRHGGESMPRRRRARPRAARRRRRCRGRA